jgi:hypothetical protein
MSDSTNTGASEQPNHTGPIAPTGPVSSTGPANPSEPASSTGPVNPSEPASATGPTTPINPTAATAPTAPTEHFGSPATAEFASAAATGTGAAPTGHQFESAAADQPAGFIPSSPPTASAPAPGPAPGPAPAPAEAKRPRPAQFGTIVWGLLLLGLCGFVAISQFGPGVDADRYLWAFVGVIAAGVALVAVGIVAAFRRS